MIKLFVKGCLYGEFTSSVFFPFICRLVWQRLLPYSFRYRRTARTARCPGGLAGEGAGWRAGRPLDCRRLLMDWLARVGPGGWADAGGWTGGRTPRLPARQMTLHPPGGTSHCHRSLVAPLAWPDAAAAAPCQSSALRRVPRPNTELRSENVCTKPRQPSSETEPRSATAGGLNSPLPPEDGPQRAAARAPRHQPN